MATKVESRPARKKSRLRRVIKWLMIIILTIVLLFAFGFVPFFLSRIITGASTRPWERNASDTPATYGVADYQEVSFPATDGVPIAAWYLPNPTKGIDIVIGHGQFRSRQETLERGAMLAKRGYGVLLLDLRHHGKSGGAVSTMGYKERFDYEGGLNFLHQRDPQAKVVFMGVSMGAAGALLGAADSPEVAAVISDSTFLSFNDVVEHHRVFLFSRVPWYFAPLKLVSRPITQEFIWLTQSRGGFKAADFDVEKAVRQINVPIFFIAGDKDVRMPPDIAKQLYSEAENPAKQLWVVSSIGKNEATHGHAFDVDPDAYINRVDQFLSGLEP